ncbi:MAG: prenyltransferase/squalene oxidase repeat-containing protein, partial [Candidatus Thorarchaeota archaeon]
MSKEWMSALKMLPIDWLLEDNNPPVRYYTMRDLLVYKNTDSDMIETKNQLANYNVTQRILNRQNPDGSWESADEPYLPKYKSSYWQIMFLAMFGLDRSYQQVERAIEHILRFQLQEGGFATFKEEGAKKEYEYLSKRNLMHKKPYPQADEWIPARIREMELSCLTGNMALALIRLGYSDHRAVKDALDWLVEIQNTDGGWLCPYWGAHKNDKHGCFMGTITPLDAFSEAPKKLLNVQMKKAIEQGLEFLLMHRLYRADHHEFRPIKNQWL